MLVCHENISNLGWNTPLAFLCEIYPETVLGSQLCWYWQDNLSIYVLSVTVHPIDGKAARTNSFPQKSNECVVVLVRYSSERSESPQVHQTEENHYLLTDAHKKTADNEIDYRHERAQVLLTTAWHKSGKQHLLNEHLTSTSYVRNEMENNKISTLCNGF